MLIGRDNRWYPKTTSTRSQPREPPIHLCYSARDQTQSTVAPRADIQRVELLVVSSSANTPRLSPPLSRYLPESQRRSDTRPFPSYPLLRNVLLLVDDISDSFRSISCCQFRSRERIDLASFLQSHWSTARSRIGNLYWWKFRTEEEGESSSPLFGAADTGADGTEQRNPRDFRFRSCWLEEVSRPYG